MITESIEILSNSQLLQAKYWIEENQNASDKIRRLQNGKTRNFLTCEESKGLPFASLVTNELKSLVEVTDFANSHAEKYFAYVTEAKTKSYEKQYISINTWTGSLLGYGIAKLEYRSNLGDTRQTVYVKGINNVFYYGTYYKSRGNYCRLYRVKDDSPLHRLMDVELRVKFEHRFRAKG